MQQHGKPIKEMKAMKSRYYTNNAETSNIPDFTNSDFQIFYSFVN